MIDIRKFGKMVMYTFLLYVSGCKAVFSKPNTPAHVNSFKQIVQQDLADNKELAQDKDNVPQAVDQALRPKPSEPEVKVASPNSIEKRFNVSADQVEAKAFFLGLISDTSYNIVVHPNVSGKISLQLNNVSIKEVLDTVRNVYGYDYRFNGKNIELLPAALQSRTFTVSYLDLARGGQSETRVVSGGIDTNNSNGSTTNNNTNNNNATNTNSNTGTGGTSSNNNSGETLNSRITTISKADYWTELKKAIEIIIGNGEGRKVAVSPLAGVVVVHAMPDELYHVEKFLENSQAALQRQVILEAKILEVTLNDENQAGINWAMLADNKKVTISNVGSGILNEDLSSGTLPTLGLTNGLILSPDGKLTRPDKIGIKTMGGPFGLAMNLKNFSTFIEVLKTQGKVHVLSSPRVSTTNNQKALIKVGKDEFFVTNVSSTNVVGATTTNSSPNVSFQSFFSGIALDVTPHISSEGDVTLHIHPSITAVAQKDLEVDILGPNGVQTQTFPLAASNIRESDSIVRAKNGQVVVIGGLMQDQVGDLVVGVPILKDLPIFGALFKQTKKTSRKSELVILLRPHIVNDERWNKALEDEIERFENLQEKPH